MVSMLTHYLGCEFLIYLSQIVGYIFQYVIIALIDSFWDYVVFVRALSVVWIHTHAEHTHGMCTLVVMQYPWAGYKSHRFLLTATNPRIYPLICSNCLRWSVFGFTLCTFGRRHEMMQNPLASTPWARNVQHSFWQTITYMAIAVVLSIQLNYNT